jgi:hypothetical protein
MERTYTLERAAHVGAVTTAKGCRSPIPRWWIRTSSPTPHICARTDSIVEIVATTGMLDELGFPRVGSSDDLYVRWYARGRP